jgi:CRP/FNR family transcriptional regulator, cyclic AMP receptor protein
MQSTLELFRNERNIEVLKAGETIFRQGDEGDCMYVLLDGEVDIYAQGRHINTLRAGEIFGEMALIDDQPRSGSAIANTDCRVARVDRRRFTFLVQQTPFFSLEVMHVMAERLRGFLQPQS